MKGKKFSRKELKQPDEFITFWEKVFQFALENKRQLILGVTACLIVVLLICAGVFYNRKKEENASKMLAEAQSLISITPDFAAQEGQSNESTEPDPESVEKALEIFSRLAEEYGNTHASQLGRILQGHLYYEKGDYDAAAKTYQDFLEGKDESDALTAMAREGLGYSYEALEEFSEAVKYYEQLTQSELTYIQAWSLLSVARCKEKMNENEGALEAYRTFLVDHPQHVKATEAKANIARLSQLSTGIDSMETDNTENMENNPE